MKLTPEMQAQLQQLKDIHLPEPISWYPLAIGWWIVIAVILLGVLIALWWFIAKRQTLKKHVLAELQQLSDKNPVAFSSDLSALLRRVAIYHQGQSVQALSGQAWADFLSAGQHGMPQNIANALANAPYHGTLPDDVTLSALRQAAETWILHAMKRTS